MNKIIFLAAHPPTPDIPEAGHKEAYRRLMSLSRANEIHLVFFYNTRDKEIIDLNRYAFCKTVLAVPLTKVTKIRNILSAPFLPTQVAMRFDRNVNRHILVLQQQHGCSGIHIEWEQCAEYLTGLQLGTLHNTVAFQDVISQSISRFYDLSKKLSFARFFYALELKRTKNWEKKIIPLINEIIVLNEKDKSFVGETFGKELKLPPITVSYPIVSERFFKASRTRRKSNVLVFWGAMNRFENEDAVLWFVNKIFPTILLSRPDTRLIVLGANPSPRIQSLNSGHIHVTGFVDDPIPYFEEATLSVAPLRYGAGIKLKVLEAIAAGLRVVGTEVAAEGVDFKDGEIVIANDEATFAAEVQKYLALDGRG